jgi:hypothetical protein
VEFHPLSSRHARQNHRNGIKKTRRPRKMSMAGMTLGVSLVFVKHPTWGCRVRISGTGRVSPLEKLEQSGTYGDRLHLFCSTSKDKDFIIER